LHIFTNKEYGKYVTCIFAYCLAALFHSKLEGEHFHVPFFLQIACDRKSVLYDVVQEIVDICDVNIGIYDDCRKSEYDRAYCGYTRNTTHYPTDSAIKNIEDLSGNRDIPVIIDGYKDERNYTNLLRTVANIRNRRKSVDARDRFGILPIFVTQVLKSEFKNVLSMDLTELDVSSDYLELLRDNKQTLASWVSELVRGDYKSYLFQNKHDIAHIDKKHPFYDKLRENINRVCTKYRKLTPESARNVGFLNFFIKGFLEVFEQAFLFKEEDMFKNEKGEVMSANEVLEYYKQTLTIMSERALVELHELFMPMPVSFGVKDKEGIKTAKRIEKFYLELGVRIRVTLVEANEGKFKFNVSTIAATKDTDIINNASTVQRRLKYEYFRTDLTNPKEIIIFASEKASTDNSLKKILESDEFENSKMIIPYAVGYDDMGAMCIEDIKEFPNLLIGGTTSSGKSTAMRCLIMSVIYKHRNKVKLLLSDMGGLNESKLELFDNHPALLCSIIRETKTAFDAIIGLYNFMKRREREAVNTPYIVCVIDEFPRLFSELDEKEDVKKLENTMTALLSGYRRSGIYIILAAQHPKSKYFVCDKANLPARMAFKCVNHYHSASVLGNTGAEKLFGKGRLILETANGVKQLQGAYISEDDAKKMLKEISADEFVVADDAPSVEFDLIEMSAEPSAESAESTSPSSTETRKEIFNKNLIKTIELLLGQGRISNNSIQKEVGVGFNIANDIIKIMESCNLLQPIPDNHNNRGKRAISIENIKIEEISKILQEEGCQKSDADSVVDKISSLLSAKADDITIDEPT